MIRSTSARTSKTTLYSIAVLYLVIIVLIFIFARQFLSDVSSGSSFSNIMIIFSAVVLPAFLIGSIILNFLRLRREKRSGSPGVFFKTKLVLFFSFIAMISAVPQGILSVSFLRTAMESWFSSSMGVALHGGLDIALEYYNEKLKNLEEFGESRVLKNLISTRSGSSGLFWDTIQEVNPLIDSLQLYDSSGREIAFLGEPRARLETTPSFETRPGMLPKQDYRDMSLLRYLSYVDTDEGRLAVLIGSILPGNFEAQARGLTESIELFTQYQELQNRFYIALIIVFAFFSVPLLLLAIIVSFMLSDEVIKPIVSLEEATRKVAEGDFTIRIFSRRRGELSVLIDSFNTMVSELERSRFKIMQTEKVTAWQEIAQQMAHEIKNPLTPIKLSAQRIIKKYQSGSEDFERILTQAVESIIREVDNLDQLLKEFRDFSRQPTPMPEKIDINSLLVEVLATYATTAPFVQVDTSGLQDDLILDVDKKQMTRVFSNLIKNAFEAQENGGTISLRTNLVRKGNNRYCRIQIQDTGKGIVKENHDKVFNPYFTTKMTGTGLGLPIVERIIFDHQGEIWFETEEGVGTTFFIDLPMGNPA
ncbi:MAG: HAMP domain-containing protein [Spirochaetales bacterium]|nr:HAMP domain-containing protein [Spirochaetales bacterium]